MKKTYFLSLFTLISFIVIIAVSCGKSGYNSNPTPPPPTGGGGGGGTTTGAVSISSMSYSPKTLTVAKGTVVKWTNNDSYAHTVTSNDGTSFDSKSISGAGVYTAGGAFSYTANTAGTFEYHCTIHGLAMSGTLVVSP